MNIEDRLSQKQNLPSQAKKSVFSHLGALLAVFFIIFITNFPFNSWYTGWDNLHPEFNFWLNFKRALLAVWQTNQGLGTYGGHGYAATLPHTIILFLMSFVIPIKYLRATFTFLMLLFGVVGVFFLIRKFLAKQDEHFKNKAALLGGLFYLLNFATVQNFYIQLEVFIVHFAALPWLFLTLIDFLEKKTKKSLLLFSLITFVSSIQGFIPPLFFVYFFLVCVFLFFYLINKFNLSRLKDVLLILLITFMINAYWLGPVINYSLTRSSTYLNAYNNLSSTEDFILKNKKYGDLKDLIFLKGFIIEAQDTSSKGVTTTIFSDWQKHLDGPMTALIGYLFFGIILIGAANLVINRGQFFYPASFVGLLFIFSSLATNTFPFSYIYEALQKFPILHQAFRVAFTKFSIALAFFYSISFAAGVFWLLSKLKKMTNFLTIILIGILIYFALPTFQGNFLYRRTKINIPKVYFELFDFFKNQDKKTRIANLPIGWHWGWSVYKWGYSGSGFLWYGIEQPIMDRAFDVWGKYNENYYWELSYAIYSENFQLFDNLVEKYQINWLLLDKNIIPYPNAKGFLYSDKLEKYLESSKKYELAKVVKPDASEVSEIKVYKTKLQNPSRQFIAIKQLTNLKNVGPAYDFTDFDQVYNQFGEYYSNDKVSYDVYYHYRSLFTKRSANETNLNFSNLPVIYDSNKDANFLNHNPTTCGSYNYIPSQAQQKILPDKTLQFSSINTENCYVIVLDQLSQRDSYLLSIENRHIKGKKLQLAIINHDSRKADIELSLANDNSLYTNYVVIPPMKYYGLGYSLTFNNISIGDIESVNELKSVKLYKLPYQSLIETKTINLQNKKSQEQVLIYYQSFDPGWKAFINGKELKEQVLVNNWANGWKIDNTTIQQYNNPTITIIFWPQYLEFFGFGLMTITFIFMLFYQSKIKVDDKVQ